MSPVREMLEYPDVVRWASIDTAPFRGGAFELRNTNHLVRTYPGCDGLKTGFYDKAGFNVAATAKRGNLRMIAVVLGTPHKLTNFKVAADRRLRSRPGSVRHGSRRSHE